MCDNLQQEYDKIKDLLKKADIKMKIFVENKNEDKIKIVTELINKLKKQLEEIELKIKIENEMYDPPCEEEYSEPDFKENNDKPYDNTYKQKLYRLTSHDQKEVDELNKSIEKADIMLQQNKITEKGKELLQQAKNRVEEIMSWYPKIGNKKINEFKWIRSYEKDELIPTNEDTIEINRLRNEYKTNTPDYTYSEKYYKKIPINYIYNKYFKTDEWNSNKDKILEQLALLIDNFNVIKSKYGSIWIAKKKETPKHMTLNGETFKLNKLLGYDITCIRQVPYNCKNEKGEIELKSTRHFGGYKTIDNMLEIHNSIPENERTFYEALGYTHYLREYYDIDKEGMNLTENESLLLINEFINLRKKFAELIGLPFDNKSFMVTKSEGSTKLSYHIINKDLYFTNHKHHLYFTKCFVKFISTHNCVVMNPSYIDIKVYNSFMNMRLIGNRKVEKPNKLLALDTKDICGYSNDPRDYIISENNCPSNKIFNLELLFCLNKVHGYSHILLNAYRNINEMYKKKSKIDDSDKSEITNERLNKLMLCVEDYVHSLYPDRVFYDVIMKISFALSYVIRTKFSGNEELYLNCFERYAKYYGKYDLKGGRDWGKEFYNSNDSIKSSTLTYYAKQSPLFKDYEKDIFKKAEKKFADKCDKHKVGEFNKKELKDCTTCQKLEEEFMIKNTILFSDKYDDILLSYPNCIPFKRDFVELPWKRIIDNNTTTIGIKSPMASGKTTDIKKFIKEYGHLFKNIVCISRNRTLSRYLAKQFEFLNYLDKKCNINDDKCKGRVISMESLHKYDTRNKVDLLIIDEFPDVIKVLSSVTLKNRKEECVLKFEHIMRNAGMLIYMSSDLTHDYVDIVNRYRDMMNHYVFYAANKHFYDVKCNAYVTNDYNVTMQKLKEDLQAGYKLCISTTSPKIGHKIYAFIKKEYPDKKMSYYYAECSKEVRDELNNIDEIWLTKDIIIYTPTISHGVSFDKQHFDKVYGIFPTNVVCSETCMQMLRRVRYTNTGEYVIFANNRFKDCLPKNVKDVKEFITEFISEKNTLISTFDYSQLKPTIDYDGIISLTKDDKFVDYMECIYTNIAYENKSQSGLLRRLISIMNKMGVKIHSLKNLMIKEAYEYNIVKEGVEVKYEDISINKDEKKELTETYMNERIENAKILLNKTTIISKIEANEILRDVDKIDDQMKIESAIVSNYINKYKEKPMVSDLPTEMKINKVFLEPEVFSKLNEKHNRIILNNCKDLCKIDNDTINNVLNDKVMDEINEKCQGKKKIPTKMENKMESLINKYVKNYIQIPVESINDDDKKTKSEIEKKYKDIITCVNSGRKMMKFIYLHKLLNLIGYADIEDTKMISNMGVFYKNITPHLDWINSKLKYIRMLFESSYRLKKIESEKDIVTFIKIINGTLSSTYGFEIKPTRKTKDSKVNNADYIINNITTITYENKDKKKCRIKMGFKNGTYDILNIYNSQNREIKSEYIIINEQKKIDDTNQIVSM